MLTIREPHGVTGHIVPWNYPMQIFGRSVGAALAAGNACVVKPAEDACLSVLRVAELAAEAGLPEGALNIVTGYGHEAGAALARHPGIDHISFTGSPATGEVVTQMAAENHVPVTLELGGKSPQIVFADADFDAALPVLVAAIVQNAGQTCSAGSRVLIERAATSRCSTGSRRVQRVAGRPGMLDLDCGPLISAKQQQRVWDFLSDAQHDGIAMAAHGEVDRRSAGRRLLPGADVIARRAAAHRLAREEVFGPVLAAMPFDDEAEALRLANGTRLRAGRGYLDARRRRQMRVARRVRSGQVFINNYGAGGGVELPFGGVKHSGHGREKGFEALYGFTVLKTIAIKAWLKHTPTARRQHATERQDSDRDGRRLGFRRRHREDLCARRRERGGERSERRRRPSAWRAKLRRAAARRSRWQATSRKRDDWQTLLDAALEDFGSVQIVVNNAGTTHRNKPVLEVTEAEFDRVYAVNVKSIYWSVQQFVPYFREHGGGVFINIASTAGVRPRPGLVWYNGSKGAVIIASKSLAVELGPDRIRVNCVNPVIGETALLTEFMGVEDTPEEPPASFSPTFRWAGSRRRRTSRTPRSISPRTTPSSSPAWPRSGRRTLRVSSA